MYVGSEKRTEKGYSLWTAIDREGRPHRILVYPAIDQGTQSFAVQVDGYPVPPEGGQWGSKREAFDAGLLHLRNR